MKTNPLLAIGSLGQSVWLDDLSRNLLASGELSRLIEHDGLAGETSNPTIFEKAIAETSDYRDEIGAMARHGLGAETIIQTLTVADVQSACDLFRPLHDRTGGRDGFVSLEVSPHLAHDSRRTLDEARRLWAAIGRPNAMIKVPATREGLFAIRELIAEGVNVNVTLLFGLLRYHEVVDAFLSGMEERADRGKPLGRVASVASFFLSRIDALIDPLLEERLRGKGPQAELARELHGQVAIASAKAAYGMFRNIFSGERFRRLADGGARAQRLLWASVSTKNPSYSDVKYIEALIGPDTVNTMPRKTMDAYRDHGKPAPRLAEGIDQARETLQRLGDLEIDLNAAVDQLEDEGVRKFVKSFDLLMSTLQDKRASVLAA